MIPVLSAVLLMVTMGMFLQRIDAVDRWLGGGAPPAVVLHDDEVSVAGTDLVRIDVFANDENIDDSVREGLKIVSSPTCGRLLVRSGGLEYLPERSCEGREVIRYSFEGADPKQVATVLASIDRDSGRPDAPTGRKAPPEIAHAVPVADADAPAPARRAEARPSVAEPETPADTLPHKPVAASDAKPGGVAQLSEFRGTASASAGRSATGLPARGARSGNPSPIPERLGRGAVAEADPARPARQSRAAGPIAHPGPDLGVSVGPLQPGPGHEVLAEKRASALAEPPSNASGRTAKSQAGMSRGEEDSPLAAVADPRGAAARHLDPAVALATEGGGAAQAGARRSEPSQAPRLAPGAADSRVTAELAGNAASVEASAMGADPASREAPAMDEAEVAGLSAPRPVPAAVPGEAPSDGDVDSAGGDRLAALPGAAESTHDARGRGDDALVSGPLGPLRSEIEVAALVTPWDLDRTSSPTLVLSNGREGTGRWTPLRPQPGARPDHLRRLMWRPPAPRSAVFAGGRGPMPASEEDISPRTAAVGVDGAAFVLAVVGHDGAGTASGPDLHGSRTARPVGEGSRGGVGPLLAALPPALAPGADVVGPALGMMPVEPLTLPPGFEGMLMPRPRPAGIATRDTAPEPDAAMLAEPAARCTEVPGLTLDIRRGAMTVLGVTAPCQAGTVAEVTYSGLGLAVPLDGNGQGSVNLLGFEPISPAVVSFRDGTDLRFELPFLDVDRVSRVALAWDAPVELGLNALENGAALNSPGHVRPGSARSLEEVRRTGGGYLSVFWPVADVGQSVQVYSWYHQNGERPGVIRMLVDFVSRDRDRLASACGNGRDAAPSFMVLRSDAGRPEKPVIRRLDPIDCRQLSDADGASHLISGVVGDLLITSR